MNINNNVGSQELDKKDIVCEVVGCYSTATNKIAVKVGSKGTISLFLCNSCKPKFCSEGGRFCDTYKTSLIDENLVISDLSSVASIPENSLENANQS